MIHDKKVKSDRAQRRLRQIILVDHMRARWKCFAWIGSCRGHVWASWRYFGLLIGAGTLGWPYILSFWSFYGHAYQTCGASDGNTFGQPVSVLDWRIFQARVRIGSSAISQCPLTQSVPWWISDSRQITQASCRGVNPPSDLYAQQWCQMAPHVAATNIFF